MKIYISQIILMELWGTVIFVMKNGIMKNLYEWNQIY